MTWGGKPRAIQLWGGKSEVILRERSPWQAVAQGTAGKGSRVGAATHSQQVGQ